jgi:TorA maturation chaperone TorD
VSGDPQDGPSLLLESAEWHLLGKLLSRPRPGWHGEVRSLAGEIANSDICGAAEAAVTAREETYLRLLGPGGVVSPREVAYQKQGDFGHILADIAGFYEAFAYHPDAEDPIDHVSVQAGFAAYLRLKEAYARRSGNDEAAARTSGARIEFLQPHLGSFAEQFARRLEPHAPDYLARAARALADKVTITIGERSSARDAQI